MPDDDDEHIVLNFQSRPKPRQTNGQKGPSALKTTAPEDLVTGGAVIIALILAVAMVSGWVPIDRYMVGILASWPPSRAPQNSSGRGDPRHR